ncbi:MAG: class I SAM-dependent methyltransferase [Rhodomicrobium sp.]
MGVSNSETLRSYERHVNAYTDGTLQVVFGAAKDWIDGVLADLPREAKLVELGSAFGRDAAYIASKGFEIECTDAVSGFVSKLQAGGFNARLFNVLTDDLSEKYDLIFANAVLLHFDRREFSFVLKKLFHSLKGNGRFAFSLKQGQGESWSNEKIDAPRYFCYWERDNLEPLLKEAGFARWTIYEALTNRAHAEWLFITAYAPC